MRVHKHRNGRNYGGSVPQGQVLEIKGRSELAINMSISGTHRYDDWISLEDYEGEVFIKGNHVHDLVSSILRYSSPYMRKLYKELLDITDVVTNHKDNDKYNFDISQIEAEKRKRKHETKYNKNKSNDIRRSIIWTD
jgi:hypothetical protein